MPAQVASLHCVTDGVKYRERRQAFGCGRTQNCGESQRHPSDLLPAGACTARWSSEPEWKGNGVATSNWRRSKLVSAHMRADRGLNRPPDEEHGPKMAVPLGCLVMIKLYGE